LIAARLRLLLVVPWLFILYRYFASDDPNEREIDLLRLWPLLLVAAAVVAVAVWRREEPLLRAIPLLIVATVHGTFLSQATWRAPTASSSCRAKSSSTSPPAAARNSPSSCSTGRSIRTHPRKSRSSPSGVASDG